MKTKWGNSKINAVLKNKNEIWQWKNSLIRQSSRIKCELNVIKLNKNSKITSLQAKIIYKAYMKLKKSNIEMLLWSEKKNN